MNPSAPSTPPWSIPTILHEATLQLAMASIPISATIIHPAFGMVAALAVVLALQHLKLPQRRIGFQPVQDLVTSPRFLHCPLSTVNYPLSTDA